MLLYANNRRIPENEWLPVSDLYSLWVEWKPIKNYVTLVMYDVDAPSASNPSASPYLHHLVVNINGNNVRNGSLIASYTPPSPGVRSGAHRYIIALYNQENFLDEEAIKRTVFQRENFDINSFVQRNRLVLFDHDVIVVNPDTKQFYVEPKQITVNPAHPLILGNSTLSDAEKRFCSCVIESAVKMEPDCLKKRESYKYEHGHMCYNPYAVCAKSVGTSSRECPQNYNFNAMNDQEIEAFATLHNVSLRYPINREELFEMFASE
jgi:phosphatidylethanolamine-binding protein (PEBP) family uncharacterized protein